jgi:hypothetical protein
MSIQDQNPRVPEPARYEIQPGYADLPAYGVLRDNSDATVSLVLGLVGLCTFILLASPFAWWMGSRALAEIDANPGVYNNRGMAMAGKITGIIGTLILGLFVLGGILAAVLLVAVGSTSS